MNGNSYHLFASPRSPFARRIRLALKRLNLVSTEEFVDVFENPPALNAANPLGLVPTLITPEAGPLSDSSQILEYLQDRTGKIWPEDQILRTHVRQSSTLAAGVIQSSVLYFQEAHMHGVPSPFWKQEHATVIQAPLAAISRTPSHFWISDEKLTQAGWDLVVALEYLTLRLPFIDWQNKYPSFVKLHALACEDPFFLETTPKI